jgi:transcriptional regulator with XRE-family HTH domain
MCNGSRKQLGLQIRKFRLSRGLTQENLSLESNISRSHIAMIEAGKRDVTVSSLFRISRALKVSMNEIFLFDDLDKFKFDIEELYK